MQTARTADDLTEIIRKMQIGIVDLDYRQIMSIILELSNLVESYNAGNFDLSDIRSQGVVLRDLYDCVVTHFERELLILEKYDLPLLGRQRQQHSEFLELLSSYIDEFEEGRLTVTVDLKQTILGWWVSHINTVDYQSFSQENGIPREVREAQTWDDVLGVINSADVTVLGRKFDESIEADE